MNSGLTLKGSTALIRTSFWPGAKTMLINAQVAQSVEQRTENPRVRGSIPRLGTIYFKGLALWARPFLSLRGFLAAVFWVPCAGFVSLFR